MTAVVVDASALGALLFGETQQQAVAERLRDRDLHAPSVVVFEIANIAVKKVRQRQLKRKQALDALAVLEMMSLALDEVSSHACTETALATGLTAYDAAYLALARQLNAPLVTLDAKLQRAASPT